MAYDDTTNYDIPASEMFGETVDTTSTTQEPTKYNNLQGKKQQKIDALTAKSGTLLGMEDGDGALHINDFDNKTRLSPLDGQRYDAVEIKHGNNPYDMYGVPKEDRDAGKFGKSVYSMRKQREQVASIFGKSVSDVTEQDMLDVGNMQQVQTLSDIVNADDIAAGSSRWQAPLIKNSTQLNLTGRGYKDEYGNALDGTGEAPLNVSISYVSAGSTGTHGRGLSAITDSSFKTDITSLAAQDPRLNAFASVEPSRNKDGSLTRIHEVVTPDDGSNQGYLENTWNLIKRSAGQEGAKIGDALLDAAIGDGALISKDTARRILGNDNVSDNGFDFVGFDKYKTNEPYDPVDMSRTIKAQKSTERFAKDGTAGNFVDMAIDNVASLDQMLIQSAPEMAEMMATIPTFGASLALLATKKNNEILEQRLTSKIKDTGDKNAKLNSDDYLVSGTATAVYTTLGMLTQGGIALARNNSLVQRALIKPIAGNLAKVVSKIPGKPAEVLSKAVEVLAGGTVAFGAEGLDEQVQTFAEQFGADAKNLSTKEFNKIYSDEKLATKRFESFLTAGFMGTAMKYGGDTYRNVVPSAAEVLAKRQQAKKDAEVDPILNVDEDAKPEGPMEPITADRISKHLQEVVEKGESSELSPEEVQVLYDDRVSQISIHTAELNAINEMVAEKEKESVANDTPLEEDEEYNRLVLLKEDKENALSQLAIHKALLEGDVVYNNRPLGDIANDIKVIEAELVKSPEDTKLQTRLAYHKLEAYVAGRLQGMSVNDDGVDLTGVKHVSVGDVATQKFYGGKTAEGSLRTGIMQMVKPLLDATLDENTRGLVDQNIARFIGSQQTKLEALKDARTMYKDASSTSSVSKTYTTPTGQEATVFYDGKRTDGLIDILQRESDILNEILELGNNPSKLNELGNQVVQAQSSSVKGNARNPYTELNDYAIAKEGSSNDYAAAKEGYILADSSTSANINTDSKGKENGQTIKESDNERTTSSQESRTPRKSDKSTSEESTEASQQEEVDQNREETTAERVNSLGVKLASLKMKDKKTTEDKQEVIKQSNNLDKELESLYNNKRHQALGDILDNLKELELLDSTMRKTLRAVYKLKNSVRNTNNEIKSLEKSIKNTADKMPKILNKAWDTLIQDIDDYETEYELANAGYGINTVEAKKVRTKLTREINKKYGKGTVKGGKDTTGAGKPKAYTRQEKIDILLATNTGKKALTEIRDLKIEKDGTESTKSGLEFTKSELEYTLDKVKPELASNKAGTEIIEEYKGDEIVLDNSNIANLGLNASTLELLNKNCGA